MPPARPKSTPSKPALPVKKGSIVKGERTWILDAPLGSGAFGAVFRAQAVNADGVRSAETYAIKFFLGPKAEERIARAKREFSALQAMQDSHVPPLYDWNMEHPGSPFIVTRYYPSGNLKDQFRKGTPLDEPRVWRLLADLLHGLMAAHRRGLLHLDIKPENVLVDENNRFVLTDFGISQATLNDDWPDPAVASGSPGYQAPEQFMLDLEGIDTRTDLFGLGTTIWSAATGINLERRYTLLKFDREGPALDPITKYNPRISPQLAEIVTQLVTNEMQNRPGGAAELMARIARMAPELGEDIQVSIGIAGKTVTERDFNRLRSRIADPLWKSILDTTPLRDSLVKFPSGSTICRAGEHAYVAYLLLAGRLRVERDGRVLATETREGTLVGEVSTLTGTFRTASVITEGTTYACLFNAAELERFLIDNPVATLRLVKLLCERVVHESEK